MPLRLSQTPKKNHIWKFVMGVEREGGCGAYYSLLYIHESIYALTC